MDQDKIKKPDKLTLQKKKSERTARKWAEIGNDLADWTTMYNQSDPEADTSALWDKGVEMMAEKHKVPIPFMADIFMAFGGTYMAVNMPVGTDKQKRMFEAITGLKTNQKQKGKFNG